MYIHDNFLSTSEDHNLEKIEPLKWLPWVGSDYFTQESKILFLAESHYDWQQDDSQEKLNSPQFTRYVVSDQALSHIKKVEENRRIFRNIERTVFNEKDVKNENKVSLWSKVAFMNLVQVPMTSLKLRPTEDQYSAGWETIKQAIPILKPSNIVVLGSEYSKIKTFQEVSNQNVTWEIKVGNSFKKTAAINSPKIELLFIKHPSKFYSWSSWHPHLASFIINLLSSF